MSQNSGAPETQSRQRWTPLKIVAAIVSLVGAVVSVPAAFMLSWGINEWYTRMDCGPRPIGSGCYEGEFASGLFIFAMIYLPFFLFSLIVSLDHRARGFGSWWPFIVLCAVPLVASLFFSVLFAAGR
ncbi:hypothetical protein BJH93_03615 [Kocuria polaris]|nr:hypothetical protein [Kocuria polaris]